MVLFTLVSAALLQLTAIPDVYRGSWTTDRPACGREDTKGVLIGPRDVTFYQARGVVTSASQGSKGASATVSFTGEGRQWTEAVRLQILTKDRLQLTALGRTETFLRCPRKDQP